MKFMRFFAVITVISVLFLVMGCATRNSKNNPKTTAPEYRGKWEVVSFRLHNELPETRHALPYTVNGAKIISGGYEVGDTYIRMYGNGILLQNIQGIHSDGNLFYDSNGISGIMVQLSNSGNDCTITTLQEIDYCKKVTQFSWE